MKFLIIDADPQRCLLVVGTVARHFPHAVLVEAREAKGEAADLKRVTAVIALATASAEATALIRQIRAADPRIPLLMLADAEEKERVLAEGATAFLRREEWLLVGRTLARMLERSASGTKAAGPRS